MQNPHIERDPATIRVELTELSIACARALDFRDYDTFLTLFTEHAVLEAGSRLEGHAAIRAAIRRRPDELRTRHVISNVFIDVLSDSEARGISYVTLYAHESEASLRRDPVPLTAPVAVGHFEDRFARTDAGWRFASRRLQVAFRNPDVPASVGAIS